MVVWDRLRVNRVGVCVCVVCAEECTNTCPIGSHRACGEAHFAT